ncbi:MAG: hypothetical protein J6T42_03790 [Clostridia bacterium]|nr:hypothetical protein [Clostridia bacterium]
MKFKKFLAAALIVCFALAALAIFPETQKAGAGADVSKLAGYDYSVEYLLKDFGLEKIGDNSTYLSGRTVKYRLFHDVGENVDVEEGDYNYSESAYQKVTGTVNFKRADCFYKFTVTEDGSEEDVEYTVYTVSYVNESATEYISEGLAAYRAAVTEYAAELKTSSSFKVSELEKKKSVDTIAKNEYFDILNTQVVLNYCVPGSSSVSTTSGTNVSSLSFKTDKVGDYSFYYTFTDSLNNKDSTEGLLVGKDGFYNDVDGDGEISAEDTLAIPVFKFTVTNVTKPEVSVSVAEKAYLGLEYTVDCFAITATNYSTEYKLYFIPEGDGAYYDKTSEEYDIENYGDSKYIQAVLSNGEKKDVTSSLDKDSMKFTPEEKGYYYVQLTIYDDGGYSDVVMSNAISALDEYKEVQPEKQFFKYNTTSIIFLSISALSLIGIIVVLFIKPKDKKKLEIKDDDIQ